MDGWDAATTKLIDWFLQQSPPRTAFPLDTARTVIDPSLFFQHLHAGIARGPATCGSDGLREELCLVWEWWQIHRGEH